MAFPKTLMAAAKAIERNRADDRLSSEATSQDRQDVELLMLPGPSKGTCARSTTGLSDENEAARQLLHSSNPEWT